jgi:hypothetical protein
MENNNLKNIKINLIKNLIVDKLNQSPKLQKYKIFNYKIIDFNYYFETYQQDKNLLYPYKVDNLRINNNTLIKFFQSKKNKKIMDRYELFKGCINPQTKRPIKKNSKTFFKIQSGEFTIQQHNLFFTFEELEKKTTQPYFNFDKYFQDNINLQKEINQIEQNIFSLFEEYKKLISTN